MPPKVRGRRSGRGGQGGRGRTAAPGGGDARSVAESSVPEGGGQVDLVAAIREMQEVVMRTLGQGQGQAAGAGHTAMAPRTTAARRGSGMMLRDWVGLKLDSFDGSGSPIQAADWLAYMVKQVEAFEVGMQDSVRFVTQLLKGEAQIWWDSVLASRSVVLGSPSWEEFARQYERRFYPAAFLDKMHIKLEQFTQDRRSVTEYEVGFNQIVRFVPHVAHDEAEKARRFRQGLRPAIRHTLGAFPISNFCSMVEQALGVELQFSYTDDLRKTSSGDQYRGPMERGGHSSGPMQRKGKGHRYQPYRGSSGPSRAPGGSVPQTRPFAKPGMGVAALGSIVAASALGVGGAPCVVWRTTRTWCVGRTPTPSCVGSPYRPQLEGSALGARSRC